VHHLDGLGPTGPLGHKWVNLQALCQTHHSQITAREQPGGWNASPLRRRPPEPHPGLID
jgi:5-methylcytosine-specific restriction protein A